jgi:hypothetical protein
MECTALNSQKLCKFRKKKTRGGGRGKWPRKCVGSIITGFGFNFPPCMATMYILHTKMDRISAVWYPLRLVFVSTILLTYVFIRQLQEKGVGLGEFAQTRTQPFSLPQFNKLSSYASRRTSGMEYKGKVKFLRFTPWSHTGEHRYTSTHS